LSRKGKRVERGREDASIVTHLYGCRLYLADRTVAISVSSPELGNPLHDGFAVVCELEVKPNIL
jgi:hypothetical protein